MSGSSAKPAPVSLQAMADGQDEELWTVKDVAVYLRCGTSWVYLRAESGELPSLRICGLRRFIPSQVREFALRAAARWRDRVTGKSSDGVR